MDYDDMNIHIKPGVFTIPSKITDIVPSYEGLHSEESLSLSYLEEEIEENDTISENNSSSLSSNRSNNQRPKKAIKTKKKGSKINLKTIPYTFVWEEGGKNIKITGTFGKWSQFYEMKYCPEEKKFKCTINLPREEHEYKFIVDGVWKYSKNLPIKKDNKNNINNYLDLTNFEPKEGSKKSINEEKKKVIKKKKTKKKKIIRKKKDRGYGLEYPTKDLLNSEAPVVQQDYLETFLIDSHTNQNFIGRSKYFNFKTTEPFTEEKSYKTLLLGPHININHSLKCVGKKNLLEMGINFRFRDKNCTLVYYSHPPKQEEISEENP
jgi:5'-AMP-activated protein kinase regulatory beta subunit